MGIWLSNHPCRYRASQLLATNCVNKIQLLAKRIPPVNLMGQGLIEAKDLEGACTDSISAGGIISHPWTGNMAAIFFFVTNNFFLANRGGTYMFH